MDAHGPSLAYRCAIGALVAVALAVALFAVPGELPHALSSLQGLCIVVAVILTLGAVLASSHEKERTRARVPPAPEVGPSDAQLGLLIFVSFMSLGAGFALGGPVVAFAVFMLPTVVAAWWWYGRRRRPVMVPARDIARLRRAGDVEGLGRLLRALLPDGSRGSIALVVAALAASRDRRAEAPLREALGADAPTHARREAARGLARLGPSEQTTTTALRDCIASGDRRLARLAQRALARAVDG